MTSSMASISLFRKSVQINIQNSVWMLSLTADTFYGIVQYLCTACAEYLSLDLVNRPGPCKKTKVDADGVIQSIEDGNMSDTDQERLCLALGQSVSRDLLCDGEEVGKQYKNIGFLQSLNVEEWIRKRNKCSVSFLKGCCGVAGEMSGEKITALCRAIEQIYYVRNNNLVALLSFGCQLLLSSATGCRKAVDIHALTGPCGSYTTLCKWVKDNAKSKPLQCPQDGDVMSFLDNNQCVGRNWRVTVNFKCVSSVISTIIHIWAPTIKTGTNPSLSPGMWLRPINMDIVQQLKLTKKGRLAIFGQYMHEFLEARICRVYEEQMVVEERVTDKIDLACKRRFETDASVFKLTGEDPFGNVASGHALAKPTHDKF